MITIKISDDERSATVNGKNVFQDSCGNWLASGELLTDQEKQTFFNHLRPRTTVQHKIKPSLSFCKIKRSLP
jgi:hypothetical protein